MKIQGEEIQTQEGALDIHGAFLKHTTLIIEFSNSDEIDPLLLPLPVVSNQKDLPDLSTAPSDVLQ